jgi:hypothetical protein
LHVKVLSTGLVTEVERPVYASVDFLACSCIWLSWIRCNVVSEEAKEDEEWRAWLEDFGDYEHDDHKSGTGIFTSGAQFGNPLRRYGVLSSYFISHLIAAFRSL